MIGKLVIPPWLFPLIIGLSVGYAIYQIFDFGVKTERSRWEQLELIRKADADIKILALTNEKHAIEQQRIKDRDDLTADHNERLKANEDKYNAFVTNVRSGTIKLRVAAAVRPSDCGSPTTEVSSIATGTEAETSCELAGGVTEALGLFAKRKDEITISFNRCVEQLAADRGEKALEPTDPPTHD